MVIRPGAYLVDELVRLLGSIMRHEPPADIAAHCREIAAAYEQQPSSDPVLDADRRVIVRLLTEEADRFSRKANARPDLAVGGDGLLSVVAS